MALVGFGAIRSGAGAEIARSSSASRSRWSPRWTARASSTKTILCRSASSATAVTRARGRRFSRQTLCSPSAIRSTSMPRSTIATTSSTARAHPHQHLRDGDRQGLQGRLRDHCRCQACGRSASSPRSSRKSGRGRRRTSMDATTRRATSPTSLATSIPANWPRRSADAAAERHRACRCRSPSRLDGLLHRARDGQNFRKPGSFGPMAGHVNGAIGLKLAHPDRAVVVGCGDGCYNLPASS